MQASPGVNCIRFIEITQDADTLRTCDIVLLISAGGTTNVPEEMGFVHRGPSVLPQRARHYQQLCHHSPNAPRRYHTVPCSQV